MNNNQYSGYNYNLPPPYNPAMPPQVPNNAVRPASQNDYKNAATSMMYQQPSPPVPQAMIQDVGQLETAGVACCSVCGYVGLTRVEQRFGKAQLVISTILIFSIGCFLVGACVLCYGKDIVHYCSKCNNRIAKLKGCCC